MWHTNAHRMSVSVWLMLAIMLLSTQSHSPMRSLKNLDIFSKNRLDRSEWTFPVHPVVATPHSAKKRMGFKARWVGTPPPILQGFCCVAANCAPQRPAQFFPFPRVFTFYDTSSWASLGWGCSHPFGGKRDPPFFVPIPISDFLGFFWISKFSEVNTPSKYNPPPFGLGLRAKTGVLFGRGLPRRLFCGGGFGGVWIRVQF